jgi:hypothetical protein
VKKNLKNPPKKYFKKKIFSLSLSVFRFAVDETKMTLTPLSSSVDTVAIGSQSKLSSGDVQALTKSYSCAGRVATYGGGNALVSSVPVHSSL